MWLSGRYVLKISGDSFWSSHLKNYLINFMSPPEHPQEGSNSSVSHSPPSTSFGLQAAVEKDEDQNMSRSIIIVNIMIRPSEMDAINEAA